MAILLTQFFNTFSMVLTFSGRLTDDGLILAETRIRPRLNQLNNQNDEYLQQVPIPCRPSIRTFNLLDAVATNQIQSEDQVWDWIHQAIDNSVIYNSDCFAILSELNYTDWSDSEFGPVTNVSIAAYSALYELVNDEFDLSAVNEAIAALED
jgi:hypothetical protein